MGCRVCEGTLEGLSSQHMHASNLSEFESWPGVCDRLTILVLEYAESCEIAW